MTITFEDGTALSQVHYQDCSECVDIVQVDSDVERHIGAMCFEIREKIVEQPDDVNYGDSCTSTFYTLVTSKGYLDWRWDGHSNGYYSESVSIEYNG